MIIKIDPNAGVCPGVARAIKRAEQELEKQELISLGAIIHNPDEMARLSANGLLTLDQDEIEQDQNPLFIKGKRILIRSHGISEKLFEKLKDNQAELIDLTCPVVEKTQKKVKAFSRNHYQVIIVGKPGHPEVKGLMGYAGDQGVVIRNSSDIGLVDLNKKSVVLAQTTIAKHEYFKTVDVLSKKMIDLEILDTTCRHINKRHETLATFAKTVDVMLIVGGKASSNTGVLYDIASQANKKCFRIQDKNEINPDWFDGCQSIGISGGASTPDWQLFNVRDYLTKTVSGDVKSSK